MKDDYSWTRTVVVARYKPNGNILNQFPQYVKPLKSGGKRYNKNIIWVTYIFNFYNEKRQLFTSFRINIISKEFIFLQNNKALHLMLSVINLVC